MFIAPDSIISSISSEGSEVASLPSELKNLLERWVYKHSAPNGALQV